VQLDLGWRLNKIDKLIAGSSMGLYGRCASLSMTGLNVSGVGVPLLDRWRTRKSLNPYTPQIGPKQDGKVAVHLLRIACSCTFGRSVQMFGVELFGTIEGLIVSGS
jgi:hypothetical protein